MYVFLVWKYIHFTKKNNVWNLFKVDNDGSRTICEFCSQLAQDARKVCEFCSKLIIKTIQKFCKICLKLTTKILEHGLNIDLS